MLSSIIFPVKKHIYILGPDLHKDKIMVAFTSDIDWAPEHVIEYSISLFEKYETKCTFFCTNQSETLSNCNKELFELGIHPNFNPLLEGKGGNIDEVIENILNIYPESKGVRSHSLTQNSVILNKFSEKGLIYDANQFMPYQNNIKPFKIWNGLVRIPFNWEDALHMEFANSFENIGLDLISNDTNILNFHPIHIYLNTENIERYKMAKKYYHNPQKLKEYQNNKTFGIRILLINILDYVKTNNIKTNKLIEIANQTN